VLKRLAFFCALSFFLSTDASAQNINDLIQFGRRFAAQAEWQGLSPSERSCIDAALQQQNSSILIRLSHAHFRFWPVADVL
jgi:hypothetical protein